MAAPGTEHDSEEADDPSGLPDCYRVQDVAASAWYVPEWVTPAEEAALLRAVYAAPRPKWTQLARRRVQSWGGAPGGVLAERLPAWLAREAARVHAARALGLRAPEPNHALVNEYLPGQGIMPHVDGALFHPAVATVSLGGHCVLELAPAPPAAAPAPAAAPCAALLLQPRSLLVLSGALYARHTHGIAATARDPLSGPLANLSACVAAEPALAGQAWLERGTRVSLTLRHAPRASRFKLHLANQP